jgi:hypothetical protein
MEAVLDQVFRARLPVAPLKKQPTFLHELETGTPPSSLCWAMQL